MGRVGEAGADRVGIHFRRVVHRVAARSARPVRRASGRRSAGRRRRSSPARVGHVEIRDEPIELLGRQRVGAAAAVADIDGRSRHLAIARNNSSRPRPAPSPSRRSPAATRCSSAPTAAAISGPPGATNPCVSGAASEIERHQLDSILRRQLLSASPSTWPATWRDNRPSDWRPYLTRITTSRGPRAAGTDGLSSNAKTLVPSAWVNPSQPGCLTAQHLGRSGRGQCHGQQRGKGQHGPTQETRMLRHAYSPGKRQVAPATVFRAAAEHHRNSKRLMVIPNGLSCPLG